MIKNKSILKKKKLNLVFCTSRNSWINEYLIFFFNQLKKNYDVELLFSANKIKKNNDIAIFLSYEKLVPSKIFLLSNTNLVVHESDLPKDKGWSPVTWGVLKGKTNFTATLFKPSEKIDSGNYFLKKKFKIKKNYLIDEIRKKQFEVTKYLIIKFLKKYPKILKEEIRQTGKSSYLRRRTSIDSKINTRKSISSQFNHLRILDNKRYPGWFIFKGRKYKISIEKFK